MKTIHYYLMQLSLLAMIVTVLMSCEKTEIEVRETQVQLNVLPDHPYAAGGQAMIEEFLAAGVPGVSITLQSPEGIWTGTGGMADIASHIDLEPYHAMRLGSSSKLFAATLILMLHEEGILSIDDKLEDYIPKAIADKVPNGNEVTLRQLLNQTSGIPEHLGVKSYLEILNQSQAKLSAEEALQYIYGKKPLAAPGEAFSYSNSNYLLLALVIKYATGAATAYEVLEQKIIRPLGLENTFPGTKVPANLSLGYYEYYGYMKELTQVDHDALGGEDRFDGGIISSSYDLIRFMDALRSGQLISGQTLKMMEDVRGVAFPGIGHISGYGLGMMRIETDFGQAFGHYGSIYCFNSALFYFPDHQLTVAYTLNGGSGDILDILYGKAIFRHLF